MKKLILGIVLLLVGAGAAIAHSGGTDVYGCHYDRTTGVYHCH